MSRKDTLRFGMAYLDQYFVHPYKSEAYKDLFGQDPTPWLRKRKMDDIFTGKLCCENHLPKDHPMDYLESNRRRRKTVLSYMSDNDHVKHF